MAAIGNTSEDRNEHERSRPLIALVNAVTTAIAPAAAAFEAEFPEATLWNLVDDRLIVEALAAGGVTQPLTARMSDLISYALAAGADGVLLTCSMYGPVAHVVSQTSAVPVYASDDAAFEAAVAGGYSHVVLLSSRPIPLADAATRLEAFLQARGATVSVTSVLAESALEKSENGTAAELAEALASAIYGVDGRPEAVLLAQYSLAPAADLLAELTGLPVLAGPRRAAAKMRAAILGRG